MSANCKVVRAHHTYDRRGVVLELDTTPPLEIALHLNSEVMADRYVAGISLAANGGDMLIVEHRKPELIG
jgi:hypothetical protein